MLTTNQMAILKAETGINLSAEQEDIVNHFDDSLIVFANPGTGKTTTLVAGLIAAQTFFGYKGETINAMSYTTASTTELSIRYRAACAKAAMSPTVKFNTFHSICNFIIKSYKRFNIVREFDTIAQDVKNLKQYMDQNPSTRTDDFYFVKSILLSIRTLNSQMKFSDESVEESYMFKMLNNRISLEDFQNLRREWFFRGVTLGSITQGEIPLIALYVLVNSPSLCRVMKAQYKLMIVDEFQDMSPLYMKILSLVSERLIVVGDMKQQIYAFNGASPLISHLYKMYYPDSNEFILSKTFRCSREIIKLANKVIEPNDIPEWDTFRGEFDAEEPSFILSKDLDIDKITDGLAASSDIMFLARNNNDVIPIVEKLYKKGIPFRTKTLYTIRNIPIYKEMCTLADIAIHSNDINYIRQLYGVMPEFKGSPVSKNPLEYVYYHSDNPRDKDVLTMNYHYAQSSSYDIINKLSAFKDDYNKGVLFANCYHHLFDIYYNYIINQELWRLDNEPDYYHSLVSSIIMKKYDDMIRDEEEKKSKNDYYLSINDGIKCYTIHSAKGLEATTVYILNMDDSIILPEKKFNKFIKVGSILEAGIELQNERNLLYVAITRAKKELYISYDEKLTPLIKSPKDNCYVYLDDIVKKKRIAKDETEEFRRLMCL